MTIPINLNSPKKPIFTGSIEDRNSAIWREMVAARDEKIRKLAFRARFVLFSSILLDLSVGFFAVAIFPNDTNLTPLDIWIIYPLLKIPTNILNVYNIIFFGDESYFDAPLAMRGFQMLIDCFMAFPILDGTHWDIFFYIQLAYLVENVFAYFYKEIKMKQILDDWNYALGYSLIKKTSIFDFDIFT